MAYYEIKVQNKVLDNSIHTVTSPFGTRIHPVKKVKSYHYGIDLIGSIKVLAFDNGVVTSVRNSVKGYSDSKTAGNYIYITHDNGLVTKYLHLRQNSIKVKVGDRVKKGELIAYAGKTGQVTGIHLHFEIRKNGVAVNPESYLIGEAEAIEVKTHIVKRGETLGKIAEKYNTTWKKIYEDNKTTIDERAKKHGKKDKFYNYIYVGQKLIIK